MAHSGPRQASKSNDYTAKITMRLVQLHIKSPGRPVQSGRLIVFHTDLRIFREAQRWDELGQHNETDILSGPHTAKVILWWCQVEKGSNGGSVTGTLGILKMPFGTSQLEKEIVCVRVELLSCALLPKQSIQRSI